MIFITLCVDLLRDGKKGGVKDRGRLLLLATIFIVSKYSSSTSDFVSQFAGGPVVAENEFEEAFLVGCNVPVAKGSEGASGAVDAEVKQVMAAVQYVKQCLALSSPLSYMRGAASMGSTGGSKTDAFASLLSSASTHATSLFAKATSFFTK